MFSHHYGIAMYLTGNFVYVSDTDNLFIRKINITGEQIGKTSLLAGTPVTAGFSDGSVNTAKFNAPTGLTIDAAGEYLYVTDRDNHAIRQIRISDGYVTTVAGAPERRGEIDGTVATGTMNLPVEVIWYKNKLYFTDASKSLRRINLKKSTLETISGNGVPGYKNGNKTNTKFEGILGIALKGKFVFVSDYQNDTIRKVKIK
jgi:DNA-binding beta-propeller fold protein YncE